MLRVTYKSYKSHSMLRDAPREGYNVCVQTIRGKIKIKYILVCKGRIFILLLN